MSSPIIKTIWDAKIVLSLIIDHFSNSVDQQPTTISDKCILSAHLKDFKSRLWYLESKYHYNQSLYKDVSVDDLFTQVGLNQDFEPNKDKCTDTYMFDKSTTELEKSLDDVIDSVSKETLSEETLKAEYKKLKENMRYFVTGVSRVIKIPDEILNKYSLRGEVKDDEEKVEEEKEKDEVKVVKLEEKEEIPEPEEKSIAEKVKERIDFKLLSVFVLGIAMGIGMGIEFVKVSMFYM
jgi:hypothetical protein